MSRVTVQAILTGNLSSTSNSAQQSRRGYPFVVVSYDECRPAGAANSLMIVDSIIGQSYAKRRFGEIWEERLDEEVARLGLLGVLVRTVSPAANEHPGKCRECLETEQIRPAERQIAVLGGPKVVKFRLLPSIRNRSYSARASVRWKAPLDPLSFAAGDTVLTAGPTTQPHAAQTQRAPTDHRLNSHGDGSRERKETKEPGTERDKRAGNGKRQKSRERKETKPAAGAAAAAQAGAGTAGGPVSAGAS